MADGRRVDDSRDCQQWYALTAIELGRGRHRSRDYHNPLLGHLCNIYKLDPHTVQAQASAR